MLTVGRVGLDATVRLREVQRSASGRGDVVRLTGNFRGASLAETKVLRQEISALAAMRRSGLSSSEDGSVTMSMRRPMEAPKPCTCR